MDHTVLPPQFAPFVLLCAANDSVSEDTAMRGQNVREAWGGRKGTMGGGKRGYVHIVNRWSNYHAVGRFLTQ